ncbi:MAG: hypothetical protein WCI20_00065 [bacterium]
MSDKKYTQSLTPPRPPRIPRELLSTKKPDRNSSAPNLFLISIIIITVIGLLFAVFTGVKYYTGGKQEPSDPSKDTSPNLTNTSSGKTSTEVHPENVSPETSQFPNGVESITNSTVRTPMDNASAVRKVTSNTSDLDNSERIEELTRIEHDHNAYLEMPDTSVYQRIMNAIKQSIKVQVILLKSANVADSTNLANKIQKQMELIYAQEDAPYYSSAIASYSRLLADVTVVVASQTESEMSASPSLADKLSAIRPSNVEGACDAAYVTGRAFMLIGRKGTRSTGHSQPWDQLEHTLNITMESNLHIVRKNESIHASLCAILEGSARAWDRSMSNEQVIRGIMADRVKSFTENANSFIRLAAYTEEELRLMMLIARSFHQ